MATPAEKKQTPLPTFGDYCKHLADKKKLVLCHATSNNSNWELKYHRDLKSIMESYGFLCLSDPEDDANSAWVDYSFLGSAKVNSTLMPPPTPTLPGYRIDGLHIYTYRAFLDAVNHYLHMDNISHLFTIRTVPVQRPADARLIWRLAGVDNERFVYRAHTLKQKVFDFYDRQGGNGSSSNITSGSGEASSFGVRSTDGSISSIIPSPFVDSFVKNNQNKADSSSDDVHGAKE